MKSISPLISLYEQRIHYNFIPLYVRGLMGTLCLPPLYAKAKNIQIGLPKYIQSFVFGSNVCSTSEVHVIICNEHIRTTKW